MSMCGCCTPLTKDEPSRKDEKSSEARVERETEPKTLGQRVSELEKQLEPSRAA